MFKLVVALAFVAACSASYDLGQTKTYTIDLGKDFFKIVDQYGKYIVFSLEEPKVTEEPRKILIEYYGEEEEPKIARVLDEKVLGEDIYQSELLYKIFQKYSGKIDSVQYGKILEHIREYVHKQQIHPVVLYSLRAFIGDYEAMFRILDYVEQTEFNDVKDYKFGDYKRQSYQRGQYQTPHNRYAYLFDYNRDLYHKSQESRYPYQYGLNKDVQEHYYGPYNTEYQHTKGLYHQTPYKGLGYLYGKGYGYDKTYSHQYDFDRDYQTKYAHGQEHLPYNREYKQVGEHYSHEYPEKFYGQYPRYGYQYGKSYGVEYPQQYQKSYAQEYYGQYAGYPRYGYQYGKTYGVQYPQQYQKSYTQGYPRYGYQYGKTYGVEYPQQYQKSYTQEYPQQYQQSYAQEYPQQYQQRYAQEYPRYGYQYGKTYGVEYPQQYQKSYAQEYYGPYASQHMNYFRGYGDNLRYQKPYYL